MYKYQWYCRWCGEPYRPTKQTNKDGFCSEAHKQAHYRAYKKYVTNLARGPGDSAACRVTQAGSGGRRGMIRTKRI